ncbi:hypothetical protein ACQP2U_23250 [Nocardia sp. CA-084685]|uniref:hypothetical protein n=1 Tax=Nocardia sp. CA-084685 TaxID=3239970 RepID=UPI003D95643A
MLSITAVGMILGWINMRGGEANQNLHFIAVPGVDTVQLQRAGEYTIFYDYPDMDNSPARASVTVTVTAPDGTTVPLLWYAKSVHADEANNTDHAHYLFDAPQPGGYRVSAEGASGMRIGVRRGGLVESLKWVMLASVIGFVALIAAAFAVVIAVMRGISKRRIWRGPAY